jgi:hypothetical protein
MKSVNNLLSYSKYAKLTLTASNEKISTIAIIVSASYFGSLPAITKTEKMN